MPWAHRHCFMSKERRDWRLMPGLFTGLPLGMTDVSSAHISLARTSLGLIGRGWETNGVFADMYYCYPTPVFLPGESQGWGSLVGCPLWGRKESDTTKATQQQQLLLSHPLLSCMSICEVHTLSVSQFLHLLIKNYNGSFLTRQCQDSISFYM